MNLLSNIIVLIIVYGYSISHDVSAQSVSASILKKVKSDEIYLFYLHGGVVQEQGAYAVSKNYGKYEYYPILDSLANKGFNVISEVRPKSTNEIEYAKYIVRQIDTLKLHGVPAQNIVILGASSDAYITLEVALIAKNPKLNFVLLGLCSKYAVDYYSRDSNVFLGNYLSIYEKSDSKGTCQKMFNNKTNFEFEEIELNTGIDHAFLFKPLKEWIDPLTQWIQVLNSKPKH